MKLHHLFCICIFLFLQSVYAGSVPFSTIGSTSKSDNNGVGQHWVSASISPTNWKFVWAKKFPTDSGWTVDESRFKELSITVTRKTTIQFTLALEARAEPTGGDGGEEVYSIANISKTISLSHAISPTPIPDVACGASSEAIYFLENDESISAYWKAVILGESGDYSTIIEPSYTFSNLIPGPYTISAKLDEAECSAEIKNVGVKKINGPNKSSELKEAPDTWDFAQTIIVTPYADVNLSMELDPTVTMNDAVKNAISWSKPYLSTGSLEYDTDSPLTATFKASSGIGEVVITASCGSSQRIIRVVVVVPQIYSVTIDSTSHNNIEINKDDKAENYNGIVWKDDNLDGVSDLTKTNADTNKPYSPVAYKSTNKLQTNSAFKIEVDNTYDKWYDVVAPEAKIRYAPYILGGAIQWQTEANYKDLSQAVTNYEIKDAFHPSAQVGYDGSFEIAWEVGFRRDPGDSLSWNRSYSTHELYLTYEGESPNFETVFHIGCTNANGNTSESDIVSDIWSAFSSSNNTGFSRKDGVLLKYYGDFNTRNTVTSTLLSSGDGQCGSWSDFFSDCLLAQGISNSNFDYITIFPDVSSATYFIVKNWTFKFLSISTGINGINDTLGSPLDIKIIPTGNGEYNQTCITAGINSTLDTTPAGDDQISGTTINTGNNGICETTAMGDDVQEIPLNQGKPNTICIVAGTNNVLNSTPVGDDAKVSVSTNPAYPYQNLEQLSFNTASYSWGIPHEVDYTTGTSGKNQPRPQALFNKHLVIGYNGKYYDPSYGLLHTDLESIDKCLSGFALLEYGYFLFMENPAGVQVRVEVTPW